MNKIPKVINYCWFGNGEKSKLIKKCIKSWKEKCPEYEIKEWNESNFDIEINSYVKEAYENKKWAFVTDYVRLWIIYNYGGIYLDTDVELTKNLDDLLEYNSFFAIETSKYINTGLGFGAEKENTLVKRMLDDYESEHFVNQDGTLNLLACPARNTDAIKDIYDQLNLNNPINVIDNNAFLGEEFFCPYNGTTGEMKKTKNTHGIHWYNASWRDKSINIRRNILRPIKRIIGMENFEKIKNKFMKEGR